MTFSSAEKPTSSTTGSRSQDTRGRAIHSRQHTRMSKPKAPVSTSANPKSFNNYQANKEATDVPNPVPDTGLRHTGHQKVLTSAASIQTSPTSTGLGVLEASRSLLEAATITTTDDSYPSAPLESQSPSQTDTNQVWRGGSAKSYSAQQTTQAISSAGAPTRLSTVAVVFLSIAAGAILIGLFVVVRLAKRSSRGNLKPSLPTSESISYFEKDEPEGSPIFGGKERASLSIHGSSSAIWAWTPYQSGIPKPAPALTAKSLRSGETHSLARDESRAETGYLSSVEADVLNHVPANVDPFSDKHLCSQPAPIAVTRAVSRLSTVSASLHLSAYR
ncbi:hypothetical protein CONPUDRAFT_149965 [Coniophora puteana RWD-64-598 SS2]|uniref:Uncharacterized protein n=1 Tax=Coniophora puteana (strain RWD-64-598) TaxID=741705 RepID=A0A5M3N162_CONPW|nr:uncharacterized protein CONPUDRAFT_149965 [Coniophora puteana RWD-64-598 SS2]EIW85118.1 hypothetical protein CONPUDRAFT_149965 [Coniophora puteana RWD-64-598 SS2]